MNSYILCCCINTPHYRHSPAKRDVVFSQLQLNSLEAKASLSYQMYLCTL